MDREQEIHKDQPADKFHSRFLDRVCNYRLINFAYNTANNTYQSVKNSNSILRYAMETAENNVYRIATPITYNVMSRVYSVGEPLIEEIDDFACRQLDKFEGSFLTPYETVTVLPYIALDKTMNVAEGTMDYFLPARKEAQVKDRKYEERAKAELEKAKALGEKEGYDFEKTKSNFRYLRFRGEALANSFYERLRERLACIPLVLPILDRTINQINHLRNSAVRAIDLAAQIRAFVIAQLRAVSGLSWRVARTALGPFYRLFNYVLTAGYARAKVNLAYIWNIVERLLFISHRREQRAAEIRKARWLGHPPSTTTGTAPKKTEKPGHRKPPTETTGAKPTSATESTTSAHPLQEEKERGGRGTESDYPLQTSHAPSGKVGEGATTGGAAATATGATTAGPGHHGGEEYKEGAVRDRKKHFEAGVTHGK